MSQFLEEQCNDVGWSYSGADTPNTMHIGLNFTTHNRNTALVLSCIETITGHVPLIPPPCPNSGVRRNSTKYHLRCPTGWGANNRLKCEKCPPGYHVKNESCAPCTRGTYIVNSEDIDCIKCPHGQTTLSDGAAGEHMCVAQCPPGFFSARSGLAPCIACPKGQYQPDFGQEQCILCDQGLTTADLATVNVNGCKSICNPGHYSSNGVQPCEACPRGLYNNISGATSCQRCPDNQSTDFEGASSKNDCHETDCASTGCKNHGDCYNGRCNCDLGFTGIQCDIALNLCHADFCLNGGSYSEEKQLIGDLPAEAGINLHLGTILVLLVSKKGQLRQFVLLQPNQITC
ncbi:unnamed protein product [Bursaphelenchus okinawaensis]|uniref:EGF-like domain-containing protein n=1 Tax=Bursaphelenchus okinawaensis TaxID=465554 RepID=A0A811L1C1_9BILA|nr:unnamed protein product [Bursaphelenchus okinawaensis]CAG9115737.1 unnamed protein product [Bursaphelenchus okinawaensis]